MRILYFLSAVVLAVVLIVGCTGDPKGVVDPVETKGLVPPPPPAGGECSAETPACVNGEAVNPCTIGNEGYFASCLGCDKFVQCSEFGQMYVISCAEGTIWDQDVLSCVEGDPTTCTPPCSGTADPCDPNPCLNGGECFADSPVSYICTCAPGYTGTDCEIDIDDCAANPCVNGQCQDGINEYNCVCDPGWTGTNCDNPEVTDADGDGVDDDSDNCANTASGDVVDATGCSIPQYCPCDNNWKNHGAYVSCVAQSAENFVDAGLITEAQKGTIVSAAAQSNCGKKK